MGSIYIYIYIYGLCKRAPRFNAEGNKTAAYCKQHVGCGIVDVFSKRCSHDPFSGVPTFNVEGSKTGVYCKEHAENGMVDVRGKRCSHDTCTRRSILISWEATRRRIANNMLRTAWWTSLAANFAHTSPAQGARVSLSKTARRRSIARSRQYGKHLYQSLFTCLLHKGAPLQCRRQ